MFKGSVILILQKGGGKNYSSHKLHIIAIKSCFIISSFFLILKFCLLKVTSPFTDISLKFKFAIFFSAKHNLIHFHIR